MRINRGGLIQTHDVKLSNGEGLLIVAEVWHWRWFSVWCNYRNRRKHGWTIISKTHPQPMRERVVMVQRIAPSKRMRRAR